MKQTISLIALLAATPALAEDSRQLDAHEHGVGALNIAIDGTTVAMEFHAPGADIVGFEHAAESEADRAAIDAAVATLAAPLDLFVLPAGAECVVTEAKAKLESEEDHDDHKHEDHKDHDDHGHDDHAGHDDHDHEKHAEHDDHDHDDHAKHDDHDHDHAAGSNHTEFHAEYMMSCAKPDALTEIAFAYFDRFENAREVEVQIVTSAGAQAHEVTRDAPTLDLKGLF